MWMDLKSAIVADTVYSDNKLVGKDVNFTLPGISMQSAEIKAMGTMSVPIVGLMDDMELAITKIGVDQGLSRLSRLEKQNLEFRWAQSVVKSDGYTGVEGCKAFVRAFPKTLPGMGVEVGSAPENELTYGVSRLQIFCGGKEFLLVDRLAGKLRIDGKDYMQPVNNLL